MKAKTVIFYCNWSTYPGLQLSRFNDNEKHDEHKYMVSMCSGRISPELILKTFQKGASGVLITACPDDKCEHGGNYKTIARVRLIKRMLEQFGVNINRLKLEMIDKGESAKFKNTVDKFMGEIKEICSEN